MNFGGITEPAEDSKTNGPEKKKAIKKGTRQYGYKFCNERLETL
jgi:hypothetical protein